MSFNAVVKSVLSADTLVLRGRPGAQGQPPKERVLHLDGVAAPAKLGNRERDDEPWAFESREATRTLLVGKEVAFTVTRTVSTTTPPLEFGIVSLPSKENADVAIELVKAGWAKVREAGKADEKEGARRAILKEAEEEAKRSSNGIWSGDTPQRNVNYSMPEDPFGFLAAHKGKQIEAVVEACPNASTLRVRLIMSPSQHQVVGLGLAGIRAPRASQAQGTGSDAEPLGDEARFFVESRLLQRTIRVTLLSLPTPTTTPSSFNSTAPTTPSPPTMFLGTVHHPAGNIAALIVSSGLAKIIDWHAGFLSQSPTPNMMSDLRKAETEAKSARRGVWKELPATAASGSSAATATDGKKFDAVVTRVWGADMMSVIKEGEATERRLQLSSIRQPKPNDPKLGGLQAEAKELLRKRFIGKHVHVLVDYTKPAEGDYEARDCTTIKLSNGTNAAEMLAERGLVYVIRHRQGDDQRASDYDKLMAVEAKAAAESKGVHSGKEFPLGRTVDASESAAKAAPFLSSLKRSGRIPAIVDFVASGSRFKILIPKQDIKLTLVLSSIRAPRTARNAHEKSEAYGSEAAAFATRRVLQRDVEISVDSTDRSGGFLGKVYLGKDDFAVLLVKEGLAKINEYATPSKDLAEAQEEAKSAKKNLWASYDETENAESHANGHAEPVTARQEYVDIIISDVRGGGETPFSFAVQILKNGSIPALEDLMSQMTIHNKDASGAAASSIVPRANDIVSAQFTADDTWYRARVRRANPQTKTADVVYIDYGNSEQLPFSRIRALPPNFKSLEHQAKEATLSFVTLLGSETEYGEEAVARFRELCEGRQLVANIDVRESNLLQLSLFDPKTSTSPEASINVDLVRDGLARVDRKSRLRAAYPKVVEALEGATNAARSSRAGAYELGDVLDD